MTRHPFCTNNGHNKSKEEVMLSDHSPESKSNMEVEKMTNEIYTCFQNNVILHSNNTDNGVTSHQ